MKVYCQILLDLLHKIFYTVFNYCLENNMGSHYDKLLDDLDKQYFKKACENLVPPGNTSQFATQDDELGFIVADVINNPSHYTAHPSKIECIEITEHMNFCLGNAIKYIWRASLKNGTEDLKKAIWYLNREITKIEDK